MVVGVMSLSYTERTKGEMPMETPLVSHSNLIATTNGENMEKTIAATWVMWIQKGDSNPQTGNL